MSIDDRIEAQVNAILAKWNPLDVPDFIAQDEYGAYVNIIVSIGGKQDELAIYLKKLLVDSLGLDLDEESVDQQEEIQQVAHDISQILQ